MSRPSENVAANVRRLRQERGWSLERLSEELRRRERGHVLSLKVLSKIETGERGIDVDDLVALAEALSCTATSLLADVEATANIEIVSAFEIWQTAVHRWYTAKEKAEAMVAEAADRREHARAQLDAVVAGYGDDGKRLLESLIESVGNERERAEFMTRRRARR